MAVGYLYAPGMSWPTIPDVLARQISEAGTGLGARTVQGCELGSFLVGNDSSTVPDIEVVQHRNRLSVR